MNEAQDEVQGGTQDYPQATDRKQSKVNKNTKVSNIGTRYRVNRVEALQHDGAIDHLVVGSGIGGLACAAALSKMGKKVLVLEQHYTAGGFTHSYQRHDYEWDVGVHYLGQVGNTKTGPGALFRWLSEGRLKWDSLGEVYDDFLIDGQSYQPPIGRIPYKEFLLSRFPNEKRAINAYLKRLYSVERWLPCFLASKFDGLPGFSMAKGLLEKIAPKDYSKTTTEVFDRLTDNPQLKAVWAGQWGDLGLPPSQSSFFLHCLIASHYIGGGWYPRGGSAEIARSLLTTIQGSGGDVMTYAEVTDILIQPLTKSISHDGCTVKGVRMKDGSEVLCDSVVSSCGWLNTQRLLPKAHKQKLELQVDAQSVKPSSAHLCLYVGFELPISELAIPTGNLWVHHSSDFSGDADAFETDTAAPIPFVYISSSAARDTTWSQRHPNHSVMELVSVVPMDEFKNWVGSRWGKRSEDYEQKKAQWSERLLNVLYQQYPHLKGKVAYSELSTPLSTEHFMAYKQGEIYGLAHTPMRYQQKGLRPKTDIEGLYLTGQDALTSGVVGAAMAGALTAAQLTVKDYRHKMLSPFRKYLHRRM